MDTISKHLEIILDQMDSVFGLVALASAVIEWLALVFTRRMESNKEGWINMLSYALDSFPYFFIGKFIVFVPMMFLYEYRLWTLGTQWYIWILAYLVYDFMFWLVHYLGHKVRFFWCIHGVHHTAKEMKLTVAVRGSFVGFLHIPLTVVGLPLLGFNPFMIYIVEAIARLYGLYEHMNDHFDKVVGRLTWMEKLFVTPSIHRVHHASNRIYLDRNYGETFSIWDLALGTFQSELDDVKPVYGMMDDKIDGGNIFQVQLQLWKDLWRDMSSAPKWSDKLKYVYKYPGWNHIDGGKTADALREEAWNVRAGLAPAPNDENQLIAKTKKYEYQN